MEAARNVVQRADDHAPVMETLSTETASFNEGNLAAG
jgi:hypothetical protein